MGLWRRLVCTPFSSEIFLREPGEEGEEWLPVERRSEASTLWLCADDGELCGEEMGGGVCAPELVGGECLLLICRSPDMSLLLLLLCVSIPFKEPPIVVDFDIAPEFDNERLRGSALLVGTLCGGLLCIAPGPKRLKLSANNMVI
jgi:hypothetical protein